MNSKHQRDKSKLHPANKHSKGYNFDLLSSTFPPLKKHVVVNNYNTTTIDFSNREAVLALNKALLMHYYNISYWNIPKENLCPPVPGRADYIHHIAELLHSYNSNKTIVGHNIRCIDIGVGANCIYPIIGRHEYGWSFIGSDIDKQSTTTAREIIERNPSLKDSVTIVHQKNSNHFFKGIIGTNDKFDLTICNPPFHASKQDAYSGNVRKTSNIKKSKKASANLNFGGRHNELWCIGGEKTFIQNMIKESTLFQHSCFLFSTLVSKQSNLRAIYNILEKVGASEVKTIPMAQGNKISRIIAWSFLTKKEQKEWAKKRWRS